ncbi:MAG: Flp family type IVb pilin [Proteobacteria bacterium]|nr:Flp family type IVb pilin [Pseudomonadota bacterium]
MRSALLNNLRAFRKDDDGVTLVEYGVAVALAVAVGIGALTLLAGDITGALGAAGAVMP